MDLEKKYRVDAQNAKEANAVSGEMVSANGLTGAVPANVSNSLENSENIQNELYGSPMPEQTGKKKNKAKK